MGARHLFFGYAWIPLISAAVWLGIMIALLSCWAAEGHPQYMPGEGKVVYISDVGAHLKPLFIVGTSITAPFFVLALATERYLRHKGRLHRNVHVREKVFSVLAVLFAAGGGACLIALSIRDAFHHSTEHWRFTIGFIVCVAVSAIFTTAEWGYLRSDYGPSRLLKYSYAAKILIVILAIILAIVLGVYFDNDSKQSVAAGCEWTISFLFDVYLWTLVFDLFPAVNTGAHPNHRYLTHVPKGMEMGQGESMNGDTGLFRNARQEQV